MRGKKAPNGNRSRGGRRTLVVISLLFALLAGSGLAAMRSPANQPAEPPPAPPVESAAGAAVSPMGLTPNSPSKEYVYIGGKLVATEEPAP